MDEVAWTKAADGAGFKYSWATEHHFLEEYSHLSANESFIAYLAGVTSRIHVGSGIINITPPVNPPARVAERVAMIDHLSGGRFEFGVGRGSSTTEQKGFGIDDPELTKEMVDEVLPQFKRMWRETDYSFEGRFFSMPPRNVLPKPFTDPHPPMWIAAGNPSTFQKAARMGLGVLCFTMGSPESLKPLIETYKNEIEHAEPVGEYVNNNIMVTSQMLCLEDGQRARDIACNMTSGYQNSLVFRYLDTFPKPPGIPTWPDLIPEPTPEGLNASIDAGLVCIGTPDEVNRSVQGYVDAGADQLVFGMLSTTMPVEVAIEAVETFGRHVLPTYDTDPVHSTQRQREAFLAKRHA
jgi:alkanesulfonate monooxygenase SsuD/methylene tetrahydromethanopterin reductase-like flavin-dependent oxidoreductase (luciferase family)